MTSRSSRTRWVSVVATTVLIATGSLVAAQPAAAAYTAQSKTPVLATVVGTQPALPATVEVTTDRCLPPVHPIAITECRLFSRW